MKLKLISLYFAYLNSYSHYYHINLDILNRVYIHLNKYNIEENRQRRYYTIKTIK